MLCLKFSHENVTSKLAWTNFFNFQRYQQAPGSAPPSRDAPPPYPGVGGPSGGPTHGYGEGRGHYNRSRGASGGQGGDPRAQIPGGSRGHPASGQDRRSWAPPHSGGQRWDKTFLHIRHSIFIFDIDKVIMYFQRKSDWNESNHPMNKPAFEFILF